MTNKEKFNKMKLKDRIEYIWEYYRWHILGTVIAILFAGSIISAMLSPKPPTYPVDITITGLISIDQEQIDTLTNKFNTEINAGLTIMPTDWSSSSQSSMVTDQKMMLMLQVRELDLLIASPYKYESYMQVEDFDPFTELDEIQELKPILDKYKDNLMISKSKKTGEEHVFGIKVNKLEKLEGMETGEDFIIALVNPPKDMNAAINVISYLLDK